MDRRLEALDLNLLLALHWLLTEENVTAAAGRMGLSQPAASRALGKLRETFGDPLLVKSGSSMAITPTGEALRPVVARAIDRCRDVLRAIEPFDAHAAQGRFRIACTDYIGAMVTSAWASAVRQSAPGIRLDIVVPTMDTPRELILGEVDLCIIPNEAVADLPPSVPVDDFVKRPLVKQEYASAVRRGHPLDGKIPSLEEYSALDHVLVNPGGTARGLVDCALEEVGLSRQIAYTTSSFLLALPIVMHTDCVVTGPAPFVELMPQKLHVFPPPLNIRDIELFAVWHPNWTNNAQHRFLRDLLMNEMNPCGGGG